jgi:hypothetical protein
MAPQFDRDLREKLHTAGCTFVRQGKGSHEIWYSPLPNGIFLSQLVSPVATPPMQFFGKPDCRRHFEPESD